MMDMRMLNLVHKLENKYGSMSKVPNDDSDFLKLRKIASHTILDDAADLLSKGYSVEYCTQTLNVQAALIRGVAGRQHIKIFPKFRYKLNNIFYFTSRRSVCSWAHVGNNALAFNNLKKKYQIEEGSYELPDMPIHSIYVTSQGKEQLKYSNNVKDYII